jgi:hypothetical protein
VIDHAGLGDSQYVIPHQANQHASRQSGTIHQRRRVRVDWVWGAVGGILYLLSLTYLCRVGFPR